MATRTPEERSNRAARRRQVAREMRALLKRCADLDRNTQPCIVCEAGVGTAHSHDCVIGAVQQFLVTHRDGDGS